MDSSTRRKGVLGGVVLTAASALAFVSIAMHGSNPQSPSSRHFHQAVGEPMPRWMAIGVACLFGLIGLASLIPAAFNLQVSRRTANTIAMLITIYFLGFFDVVCIRCLIVGDRFIDLPLVPQGVNTVLSWATWGVFILGFSGFAIACFVRIFTFPQHAVKPGGLAV